MSRVSILACPTYRPEDIVPAIRQSFDNLGGVGRFVRKGDKVLIKPNLLGPRKPEEATTTHPAVVKAVAELVQQAGGIVTVADSPGGPYLAAYLRKVYSATGMEDMARETGAVLNYDLGQTEVAPAAAKLLKRIAILKPVAEADVVINLPKLKTHGQMVYTGAVKNLFGVVPGTAKIDYHMRMADYAAFADALIDIYLAARPALSIMDAVVGMEGEGPSAGDARQLGLVLASEDAFALDFAALHVVGAQPMDVPVMKASAARGLCLRSIEEVEIVGLSIDRARVAKFAMPAMNAMTDVLWSDGKVMKKLAGWIKPRPVFLHRDCIGCGECARSCPARVIVMRDRKPHANLDACIRCFCCQELCPVKAVEIRRLPPAVSSVLRIVFFFLSILSNRLNGRRRRNQ